ncbi:acyltransferase family protein [Mucilaginibacter jinjuensis]|uniref:Acyltransferase n=1 Tax=Mucilaginibacter jinjuensis TaxID=1176721 RepID=A0ABY7T5I4_9SPHI|nr:acyltransferase [Mucilaginibacter jinjuensis]WCT11715.1 acyltransferase [Mucilaginibacter jinjuensis]
MKDRLHELDILRFIAAFSVMMFHYYAGFYNSQHVLLVNNNIFNSIWAYGNQGVSLFFVISGFVILLTANKQSPKQFVIARFIRLYPVFLPLCIFSFLVGKIFTPSIYHVSVSEFLINTTLIGSFFTKHMVSDVYWTLRVEIFFYAMIYGLLYFDQLKYIRKYLNLWLILSLITYIGALYFNYFKIFSAVRYVFLTQYSYFFIAGCYFYFIKYDRKKYDILYPVVCAIGAMLATRYFTGQSRVVGSIIISCIFILFYYLCLKKASVKNNSSFYYYLGEITYPLYLVHDITGTVLLIFFSKYIPGWLALILVSFLIILFVLLVYLYIEKPVRRILRERLLIKTTT